MLHVAIRHMRQNATEHAHLPSEQLRLALKGIRASGLQDVRVAYFPQSVSDADVVTAANANGVSVCNCSWHMFGRHVHADGQVRSA